MAAYFIAQIEVRDPELFSEYGAAAAPVIARHGGRYLVRGGAPVPLEGAAFKRTVVIEFPTEDAALAFWNDEEYGRLKDLRRRAATMDAAILPGYD